MTGRGLGVTGLILRVNVRRLMYQTLIWLAVLRDDPHSLRTAFDAQNVKHLPEPLIHSVRRNVELCRDFLRIEMLIDQSKAIELPRCQPSHALGDDILRRSFTCFRQILICQNCMHPAHLRQLSEHESRRPYVKSQETASFPTVLVNSLSIVIRGCKGVSVEDATDGSKMGRVHRLKGARLTSNEDDGEVFAEPRFSIDWRFRKGASSA